VYVEIQFESQDAANTAVEQLNGTFDEERWDSDG
jgi:hypothetical protein